MANKRNQLIQASLRAESGKIIVDGVEVGVVGEINPLVLEAWKLENPVAAFEINLQRILGKQTRQNEYIQRRFILEP